MRMKTLSILSILAIATTVAAASPAKISGAKAEPLTRALKLGINSLHADSVSCNVETKALGETTCTVDKKKLSGAEAYLLGGALGTAGVVGIASTGKLHYEVSGVTCTAGTTYECTITAVAM
jgi:hypothetical protein